VTIKYFTSCVQCIVLLSSIYFLHGGANMDSEALKTFVAIHRAEGFSNAAEVLHRSQPAISRRIAQLEAAIGAPLFDRAAGGAALSQAGRVLLPHAERVLAALNDAARALADAKDAAAGPVSLAVVGTLAGARLSAKLKRFAARFPRAALSLRTATSAEVSDLVRRSEADIGLRYFDDPADDLTCAPAGRETLCVACAAGHPLARRGVRSLKDLRGEQWLAFPLSGARTEAAAVHVQAQFLVRGVAALRTMPVDSLTAQKRLIEAGFGIALLPESAIAEERRAKTLATIAVRDLKAFNPIFAVARRRGYLNAASTKLLEILRAA
jgi:DNA-binding transcriptional LysR family regulator